jgi:hypothetical protein
MVTEIYRMHRHYDSHIYSGVLAGWFDPINCYALTQNIVMLVLFPSNLFGELPPFHCVPASWEDRLSSLPTVWHHSEAVLAGIDSRPYLPVATRPRSRFAFWAVGTQCIFLNRLS